MHGECHAHIILDGNNYQAAVAQHYRGPNDAVIRAHLEEYQKRSINFIRDGGDNRGASLHARQIAPEYGIDYRTPSFAIHKNGHYGSIVGRGFDTIREYAALIQQAEKDGADFIKIMTTGIMDFNDFGAITAGFSLEHAEVCEMVHIAHEMGFAVMSHTNGAKAVMSAIEAGVDSIEHGNFIDALCLQALAESQTAYIPTATVAYNLIGSGRFDDRTLAQIAEASRNTIAQAFEEGVILALGSDAGATGVIHGQGTEDEYRFFASVIPDTEALDARLQEGEACIKQTFKRQ